MTIFDIMPNWLVYIMWGIIILIPLAIGIGIVVLIFLAIKALIKYIRKK